MPITRPQAEALAELLCAIRPTWNARGVLTAGLAPLAKHPAALEVIVWAAVRAASDPTVLTPALIPQNGPWWNLADRPVPARLTPDLECRHHVGQWAGNCGPCKADQLARPEPDPVLAATTLDPRAAARQAAAAAKQRATAADEPPVAPPSPQVAPGPTDACPSCQRVLHADVAAPDCTQPDAHPAPGTLPHHAGHPDHTAAYWHAHPHLRGLGPDEQRRQQQHHAGKCQTLDWTPCDDGRAHLLGICDQPTGHHDNHHAPDTPNQPAHGWGRTLPHPDIDWCDHLLHTP